MKTPKPDFSSVSQQDVAEAHHASTRTIREWTRWGMPQNADGTYSVFETWHWRMKCSDGSYGWKVDQFTARKLRGKTP